ncbi:MAG: hypothetical protein ACREHV_01955 [Rhizomicrobium sp.]
MKFVCITLAGALALGGCATIMEGTSQKINMNVTPRDAKCEAWRQNVLVGTYDPESQTMEVDKSRHDMELRCSAPGYAGRRVILVSSASGWGIAGALTLDFGLTDWMTGALNKYDNTVTVVLEKAPPSVPPQ